MKTILRIFFGLICFVLVLLICVVIAIQTPYVQNYITQKVLVGLNEQFGTSISVESVDIDFFGDINLYNVSAKDHKDLDFIQIPHLTANISLWGIYRNSNDIKVEQLDLRNAHVQVLTYKGDSTSNFIQFIDKFVLGESQGESEFKIRGDINILNSKLSIVNYNLEPNQQVWLDAENFNAIIKDVNVSGSTYMANIDDLNFEAEKNSEKFKLERLSSVFLMNDQGILLDNLRLTTQSSDIDGYFHLKYDSIEQFDDFGNKIIWEVQLGEDNYLGYKDLRYFVPSWTKDEQIMVSGNINGPLNNLNVQNLVVSNGNTLLKSANVNIGELMNSSFAFQTDYMEAQTSYDELIRILPEEIAANLTDFIAKLGNVDYKGAFQMDDTNLFVNGFAKSALGDANILLNMYDYTGNQPSYKGNVRTSSFNLKKLIDIEELGMIAGNVNFDGRGFDISTLRIQTRGNLNYLDLAGSRYQNIHLNGVLNREKFDGTLALNDPNAQLSYVGTFDFSDPNLKLDFTSEIEFVNLNHFGITERENSWIQGKLSGDASFSNLNDLIGEIQISELTFNSDSVNIEIPLANLSLQNISPDVKNATLDFPGFAFAQIQGQFQLEEVPQVFQNGVGQFLVNYEKREVTPGQSFFFNVNIQDNLLAYFIPELYVQPNTNIIGFTNNDKDLFELNLNSPYVQYLEYKADSVNLNITTLNNKAFDIQARQIDIENFLLHNLKVKGNRINDTLRAEAHFFGGPNKEGEFDLNFYQTFNENMELKTGFAPSTINIENQTWQINPNNERNRNYAVLDFDNNQFSLHDIFFQSDNQFIRINGEYINDNNFSLDADLENVDLAKVIPPSVLGEFKIEGIANGNIDVIKTIEELKPMADLRIDSIKMNGYEIGNFVTNATYDMEEQIFNIQGSLDRDNVNTLFLTGEIDNKGSTPQVDLIASLSDFNINILSVFLDEVLTDWRGTLSGDVSLRGDPMNPSVSGFIAANDIGFKVVYLGTTYNMQGENDFILQKEPGTSGYLTLPDVEFIEQTSQTRGMVDGLLIFSDLSNWFMDLDFETDRLLVMNTNVSDNELFYGKIFAGGNFSMYGPASDMELSGYGVNVLNGSSISLNTGATSTVETNRFIQFYSFDEFGNLVEPDELNQEISGFSMDLDMNVNEGTTVNLVLDAQSNDKIEARGVANDFKLQMNRAGNLNIDGEYMISDGIYTFKEALVIDKDFELEEGGYIRFDGDPYNATMDLKAVYSRYVNNLGEYLGLTTTQATIVDLVIAITGDLENTQIEFLIEAPDASSQVRSALQNKLANNTDERMKQSSFLLVLGRFGTEELLAAGTATGAATASAFELLGKQVGNLFSSIIPGFELNPTYLQAVNRNAQSDRIQTQYNLALNERLRINGAVGTPLGTEYNEPVTMQVELDYDISRRADNGLVLRAFSRPSTLGIENFNVNSTFAQSYGAGVVFRRSFNSFRSLWRQSPDRNSQRQIENAPNQRTESAEQDSLNNSSENQSNKDTIPNQNNAELILFMRE